MNFNFQNILLDNVYLFLGTNYCSLNTHIEVSIGIAHANIALQPLGTLISTLAPFELFIGAAA